MQRIQDMFINMEEVAEDAYKNTELLLSQYTKVMFRIEKNLVDIDYEMYAEEGKHLKEMLYDLVDFDATAEKRRIQEKLLNNDMNLCLLEIMRDSLIALRDYPKNGQLYYRLLKYRYFEAGNTNEDVMLMLRMCKAAKSYYDKVHLEKDFSLYNTPVLDFIQVTQKKKAASIIALVCGSERYAKGLKETLQFISDQIMLFYTPESTKTKLGKHKPDLWIVTEDMTSQPNQPWRADRTTPVILITGNPDAVEIKKNSGKLTVLSMPLSIVDLRKTVEIYVS